MNDFAPALSRKLPRGQLSSGSQTRKEVACLKRRSVTLATIAAWIASYTGNEQ